MELKTLFVIVFLILPISVRDGHAFQQQGIVAVHSNILLADSHIGDRLKETNNGEGVPLHNLISEALLNNPGLRFYQSSNWSPQNCIFRKLVHGPIQV